MKAGPAAKVALAARLWSAVAHACSLFVLPLSLDSGKYSGTSVLVVSNTKQLTDV